jgi:hypothetical protein
VGGCAPLAFISPLIFGWPRGGGLPANNFKVGLSGRYYSDSTRSPSSTQTGITKSVVFGRVAMGIRARGINEGADGVAIFYPAKTWALAWIHLVIK